MGRRIRSDQVEYENPNACTKTVGGISSGTTFDPAVTLDEFIDMMLYPTLYPTLTPPSSSFSLSESGYQEIGDDISLSFSASFSRGSISPAYGTSGYRSGLPNEYNYTGTGLSDQASTSLTDSQNVASYTVVSGSQSWTCSVDYDAGEQPLDSEGNNYSSPLAAGTTSADTVSIVGVYPYYGTTSAIGTLTKQSLASMSASYWQLNMVAESGSDKQTADFPDDFSAITGIQFYNTVSGSWEWIGGSKANSLTTFDTDDTITKTIHGNSVGYIRYEHNGSLIGARQLRFYTT
jgi:hypothetical protein